MLSFRRTLIIGLIIFLTTDCATYYTKNIQFQEQFVQGEIEEAAKILDKNKKAANGKDRLLYFFQKGVVLQMLQEYNQSNQFFEEAYYFTEDFRKNYSAEVASILVNPNVKPYTGEDHELVLLHYYKALNYLRMSQLDEALVECRRINIKLNELNDRYEKKKNRYKRDAFATNLMGIIFERSGDVNNAFIAYKNAYEAYDEDYKNYFGVDVPEQLKLDLIRTAYMNGFTEELEKYEKLFGMKYEPEERPDGELIFFWHNGLGPVKDEWSINFFIVKGQGGLVMFVNEELGLSFPFPLPPMGSGSGTLGDLKFVRVAFPTYLERKPYYRTANLTLNNKQYPLELAENINEIAFKTLEDRMLRELANSLLRLAVKQATEFEVRKKNENLGALLSVINAISEKADTRNWQTLSYSISYSRIPLNEGNNHIILNTWTPLKSRVATTEFDFQIDRGETIFHIFHSLESIPLGQ